MFDWGISTAPPEINDVTHTISPSLACASHAGTPLSVPHIIIDYGGDLVSVQGLDCPWG